MTKAISIFQSGMPKSLQKPKLIELFLLKKLLLMKEILQDAKNIKKITQSFPFIAFCLKCFNLVF